MLKIRVIPYLLVREAGLGKYKFLFAFCVIAVSMFEIASAQTYPRLIINEVSYGEFRYTDGEGDYGMPWIELKNNSETPINTAGYEILLDDSAVWALPAVDIDPFSYYFIWVSGKNKLGSNGLYHTSFTLNPVINKLELKKGSEVSDSITIHATPPWNGTFGRCDDNLDSWCYFPVPTPKYSNVTIGLWENVTTSAQFYPRDSSPNASLYYKGKFWVFEGWMGGGGEERSFSNVWSSVDGNFWLSVNNSPPFDPYSSYIVFKDKMWTFASDIYNSTDGITWTKVASGLPFHRHNRVVEFNNKLLIIKDKNVWQSIDGIEWTLITDQAPWIAREFPGFHTFNNKLWFFGGGINYKTPQEEYLNDVWVSDDGVQWDLVTENTPWIGRYWFASIVFDNKMWMLGGWRVHDWLNKDSGNLNDVWFTEDGVKWHQLSSANIWYPRHAPFVWTDNRSMYVSSGYYNPLGLRNDVWKIERFNNINPDVFYLKSATELNYLSSWGTRADGSGLQPKGFNFDFQRFIICNADSVKMNAGFKLGGYGSIVELGFNKKPIHLDIPEDVVFDGNLILNDSTSVLIQAEQSPLIKKASAISEIFVRPSNGNAILNVHEAGRIHIHADTTFLNASLLVKDFLSYSGTTIASDRSEIYYADSAALEIIVDSDFADLATLLPPEAAPSKISINTINELVLNFDVEIDTVELVKGRVVLDEATLSAQVVAGASRDRYFITENGGALALPPRAGFASFAVGTYASLNPIRVTPIDSFSNAFIEASVYALDTMRADEHVNVIWQVGGSSTPGKRYTLEVGWDSLNAVGVDLPLLSLTTLVGSQWKDLGNTALYESGDSYRAVGVTSGPGFFSVQSTINQTNLTRIFPNPAVENLSISFPEVVDADVHVELVDVMGRSRAQYSLDAGRRLYSLTLSSDLRAGSYIVRIQTGAQLSVFHLNIFEP